MRRNLETTPRFFRPPAASFFLFGPRGTGKSTWARGAYPDALWVDLLHPDVLHTFAARPELLRERIQAEPKTRTVVIDEVQRVPALLDVVHALIERNKRLRFVLTGSSARQLKRTGVDLLAGRALLCSMHPFMAAELGSRFDLKQALRFGLLPLVLDSMDPEARLGTYHALYLKEEVQQEGLVRNVGSFARFLEALSFSHASVVNITNVARECSVDRKTVENYLSIFEDLLLGFRLYAFTRKARRELAAHPKFYFFDAGVFRAARPRGPLDASTEIEGAALEGLVIQHVRAWNAYRGGKNTVHFWRTRHGVEVDCVLYGPDGFWAIEVKNGRRVHSSDLRGLRSFREDYPQAEPMLLYRGEHALVVDGIRCLPCEDFLAGLEPKRSGILAGS